MIRVPTDSLVEGEAELGPSAANYVARVHRLKPGDRFVAFDPVAAREADAEIVSIDRSLRVLMGPSRTATLRPSREVTVIQAIGKGDKLDAIVRDATELGATWFVPALAERSLQRPSAERASRWRRIAIEAARQCGRGDVPRVEPPMPLAEALLRFAPHGGIGLCLHPSATTKLGAALSLAGPALPITIVIGPEGGFSQDELEVARAQGYSLVTLGPLILRTETACAAVLGALLAVDG